MLKAYELLQRGIERELANIELKIQEEMLKDNFESSLPFSKYRRCKLLMDTLLDLGYDLIVIQYEGGVWDGETEVQTVNWAKAEPGRKGTIEYVKYKQKRNSTQYMEVKS